MAKKSLKIIFYNSEYVGPQNACIGFGQQLQKHGHEVTFFCTKEFIPKYHHYGFKAVELIDPSADADSSAAADDGKKHEDSLKEFVKLLSQCDLMKDKTPKEKLYGYVELNFVEEGYMKKARAYDQFIKSHLEQINYDAIIVDSEVFPPSLAFGHNRPWFYLYCSNPIGFLNTEKLPPYLSDFPTDSDPEQWKEFNEALEECVYSRIRQAQKSLCEMFNYEPKCGDPFVLKSPYLNIYQFPKELDYDDLIEIPPKHFQVDELCREDPDDQGNSFETDPTRSSLLPLEFRKKLTNESKLIYFSMGSMGACNVELMKKLIQIFSKTSYYFIVSKGQFHDQYELPENMWGEEFIPQTKLLPLCNMAIMHGGNNGLCETIKFGKPLIIMPLFYDQFPNARRIYEKQIGFYFNPFNLDEQKLLSAIDQLLFDPKYMEKTTRIAENIRKRNSKQKLCEKIEEICQEFDNNNNQNQ